MKIIIDLYSAQQASYQLQSNEPVANVSIEGDPYGSADSIGIRLHPDSPTIFFMRDADLDALHLYKNTNFGFLTWERFFYAPETSQLCRDIFMEQQLSMRVEEPTIPDDHQNAHRRTLNFTQGSPPIRRVIGPKTSAFLENAFVGAVAATHNTVKRHIGATITAAAVVFALAAHLSMFSAAPVEASSEQSFGLSTASMIPLGTRSSDPSNKNPAIANRVAPHLEYDCNKSLNTPGQNVYLRINRCLRLDK